MARRRRLPERDELTIAVSFVRGALDAGRRPAHHDRQPTDRPDVTGSPPPEEPVVAATAAKNGDGLVDEETMCVEGGPAEEEDMVLESDVPTAGPALSPRTPPPR